MSYYFNLVFENVQMVNATSEAEIFEQMIHVDEHDAVIGIVFPLFQKSGQGAEICFQPRCEGVAITDSVLSPLADLGISVIGSQ
ncbi:MAG: hypothetical protein ACLSCV_08270 [Acutalibacteraceae bacterium]